MKIRHLWLILTNVIFFNISLRSQEIKNLPPNSPQNIRAISGIARAQLFWDANTESDLLGYNIYYKDNGDFIKLNKEVFVRKMNVISYYIKDLKNKDTCVFRVSAIDRANNESTPSEIIVNLKKHSYPAAQAYWSCEYGNSKNTNRFSNISSQTGKIKFKKEMFYSSRIPPKILFNDKKEWYIGYDGTIFVYDENLIQKWSISGVLGTISSNYDLIYCGGDRIEMVNNKGQHLWAASWRSDCPYPEIITSAAQSSPVLTKDGQIIFATKRQLLSMGYDGFYNWQYDFDIEAGQYLSIVVDDSNFIYVGLDQNLNDQTYTYKFNSKGEVLWKNNNFGGSLMILDNGDLLIVNMKSDVTTCLSKNNKMKWQLNSIAGPFCLMNCGDIFMYFSGNFYIISEEGKIINSKLAIELGAVVDGLPISGGDDTIYFRRGLSKLCAISKDLNIKWNYEGNWITSEQPFIDPNGLLYVFDNGSLVCFQLGD